MSTIHLAFPDDITVVSIQRFSPSSGSLTPHWTVGVKFTKGHEWEAHCFGSARHEVLQTACDRAIESLWGDVEAIKNYKAPLAPKTSLVTIEGLDLTLDL